jgi:hypothetical protein
VQAGVEHHFPGGRIMMLDQRLGVVEQHLLGQAAEMPERALQPLEPGRLALMPEGTA